MLLINEWNNSCNRFHIDMRLDLSTICLTVFTCAAYFDNLPLTLQRIIFKEIKKGPAYDLNIREKFPLYQIFSSYAPIVKNKNRAARQAGHPRTLEVKF